MWCALVLVAALGVRGDLPSGPAVGDKLPDLKVHGVVGPDEGKEIDILKSVQGRPTLLVFVHKITRPALQCLRPLDDYASKADKLATHVIWLGDKDKTQEYLKKAKNSLNLQMPMSVALEKEGPPAYGLNDQVTLTILVVKDGKVVANFALTDPNANDSPKVLAAVAKLLGKDVPQGGK